MSDEGPKIFIDEDWKAQVEREREAEKKALEETGGESAAPEAEAPEAPSFEALVSSLAIQAMVALGIMVPRDAKEVVIDLDQAKYLIDLLMILRDKTKGNLTPKEQGFLTESLADLQRGFVVRSQQQFDAASSGPGMPGPDLRV